MQRVGRVRALIAVTVAVLLTGAVAPDVSAARAGRPGTWRRAVASKLRRPRSKPRSSHQRLGRARAAIRQQAKRVKSRIGLTAKRHGQRLERAGMWVGIGVTALGATTHVAPEHQMKAVIGGILLATASASVAWVRLIREGRREQRAFYKDFQSRFEFVFDDFERAQAASGAGGGSGGGDWQMPRAAPSIPRPPPGQSWPADLEAIFDQMAAATTKDQLSKIYRKAARRYHPDTGGDLEQSKALNGFNADLQRQLP